MIPYFSCQIQGLITLTSKEIWRFLRIFVQTLLPAPVTAFLYLLVFSQAFGENISSYSVFLSPGLIFMSMINNAFANTVSSVFGAKFQRHIEELLVSPLEPVVILLGFTFGGMCRGLLVGFAVYAISLTFGFYSLYDPTLVCMLAVLSTMAFALAGLCNALFATKFDDISLIPTFILTPMVYLGGIFYSLSQVRGWLYQITLYNPLYYLISAFREAMIGPEFSVPVSRVLLALLFFNALLFIVNWILMTRRVGMGSS